MSGAEAASRTVIRVVDLETTGQNFSDGGVVEAGWQDVVVDEGVWRLDGQTHATLINPGQKISPETSSIHHIIDEDVSLAPSWANTARDVLQPEGVRLAALAAHRSAFEQRWCPPVLTRGVPWICTYKCALRLWPDAPSFSNQSLRYWRRPAGLVRELALPAHRAGPDAYVTAHHLRDMLRATDFATLVRWSLEPALLPRVPFGAFRGRAWRELDDAALDSLLRGEAGNNQDLLFSARAERARRDGAVASAPAQRALRF